jgi:hypothetical protein
MLGGGWREYVRFVTNAGIVDMRSGIEDDPIEGLEFS